MYARNAERTNMARKKIDDATRAEIYMAVCEGMRTVDAAKYFGVSEWTVNKIRNEEEEKNRMNDNMPMTAEEICRDYREAKDKKAQVGILAELNATGVREIEKILMADPTTGFKGVRKGAEAVRPAKAKGDRLAQCSEEIFRALKALMSAGADAVKLTVTMDGTEIKAEVERVK